MKICDVCHNIGETRVAAISKEDGDLCTQHTRQLEEAIDLIRAIFKTTKPSEGRTAAEWEGWHRRLLPSAIEDS